MNTYNFYLIGWLFIYLVILLTSNWLGEHFNKYRKRTINTGKQLVSSEKQNQFINAFNCLKHNRWLGLNQWHMTCSVEIARSYKILIDPYAYRYNLYALAKILRLKINRLNVQSTQYNPAIAVYIKLFHMAKHHRDMYLTYILHAWANNLRHSTVTACLLQLPVHFVFLLKFYCQYPGQPEVKPGQPWPRSSSAYRKLFNCTGVLMINNLFYNI